MGVDCGSRQVMTGRQQDQAVLCTGTPSHLLVNSQATVFPDNISALVPRPTRHHAVSEVSTNLTLSYVGASWVETHHEKGERDAAPPLTQQVVTPLKLSLWLRGWFGHWGQPHCVKISLIMMTNYSVI